MAPEPVSPARESDPTSLQSPSPSQSKAARQPFRSSNVLVLLLFGTLVVLVVGSLTLGQYPVPLARIVHVLLTTPLFRAMKNYSDTDWVVVEIVRMPRILEVTLSGMGLGLSGAAMQGVFRNPLVGPEICGVSTGAAFGGVTAILLGWSTWGIVGAAFAFGLLALALALGLASLSGRAALLGLILSGVIVGSFFGAAVGLAEYVAEPRARLPEIIFWLLGSFVGATYAKVQVVAAAVLVAGTILMGLRWRINLLSLGETDARTLGVNVEALRWSIVALVSLIVAAQVSISGGVAFVGLIIPHLARMLVGPEHTKLIPVSAFLGGIYLLGMDDIARSLAADIPIGVLTSFVGAPIFACLFWKYQSRGWRDD